MIQPCNGPDEIGFRYESDASSSFLAATVSSGASEYQCGMLGRNAIRCVIPPERIVKDGMTCFYYNITSMIPLSIYLKRKKFNRQGFLKFIFEIASSVNDSYGYLLNASNFVFNQDYIFVDPDTLEPSLVYVPAGKGGEDCEGLKGLISELMLQHIHVDGFDRENIVQRILSAVKSENFNLKGFITLVSELLYSRNNMTGNEPVMDITAGSEAAVCFPGEEGKASAGNTEKKALKPQAVNGEGLVKQPIPLFAVFALLLQFVMALVIYLCRGLIDMAGSNHTANYAAVLMIVLAIDVLVFKKVLTGKMGKMRAKTGGNQEEVRGPEGEQRLEGVQRLEGRQRLEGAHRSEREKSKKTGGPQVHGVGAVKPEAEKPKGVNPGADKPGAGKPETYRQDSLRPETGISEAHKPEAHKPDFPKQGASRPANKTELLGRHAKGVRMLKSTGQHAGEGDIILDKDDFIIGRLEGHVDHVLFNNAIGKLHAEMINRNGISFIKDLNSINGTYINDNRLESNKEYELKENDRLLLANSEYIFTFGS